MLNAACRSLATAVVLVLISLSSQASEPQLRESAHRSLARGLKFLAEQQADDGGWHSQTYGQLKAGPGVTALALYAYSRCPETQRSAHPQLPTRAFTYFKPGLLRRGTLAGADGTLDYPTYACALWLTSHARLGAEHPSEETRQKLIEYLLASQLLEPRGFSPDHPSYGGWDFLGPQDARGITTGTNVSLAAYVLEAFVENREATPQVAAARRHATGWLERTQQADGGFAFTPEPASLNNKALFLDEDTRERPASYGTATCDGVRALSAAGLAADDPRLQRAVKWLVEHPALDVVPGFDKLPPEAGWQRGLRYYYYASLAKALHHLPRTEREARRTALLEILLREQQADGKWINESPRMREDDPLIASSFAVAALGALLDE